MGVAVLGVAGVVGVVGVGVVGVGVVVLGVAGVVGVVGVGVVGVIGVGVVGVGDMQTCACSQTSKMSVTSNRRVGPKWYWTGCARGGPSQEKVCLCVCVV